MVHRILIVEDEFLVAMDLEAVLEDHGMTSVGIAPDRRTAMALALQRPDIAFVDINLRDGATGIEIGQRLATDFGVGVVFTSANPRLLGAGVTGTIGYLSKPYRPDQIITVLDYVARRREERRRMVPPRGLTVFRGQGLPA